jgi:hypothetical protein
LGVDYQSAARPVADPPEAGTCGHCDQRDGKKEQKGIRKAEEITDKRRCGVYGRAVASYNPDARQPFAGTLPFACKFKNYMIKPVYDKKKKKDDPSSHKIVQKILIQKDNDKNYPLQDFVCRVCKGSDGKSRGGKGKFYPFRSQSFQRRIKSPFFFHDNMLIFIQIKIKTSRIRLSQK